MLYSLRSLRIPMVFFVLLLVACATETPPEPLEVSGAMTYAMPPGQSSAAVYLTLKNNSDTTLVINHLHSVVSDHIEVHRNVYENGMMSMRQVNHLAINRGEKVNFEPGGYHLMLFGLEKPLQAGEQFQLTIMCEGGLEVTTRVSVKDR